MFLYIHQMAPTSMVLEAGSLRGLMVPSERALASSYRHPVHSNISSIITHFRDIAAFVLQHNTFSHPTSSLPQISPCFSGSRYMVFATRREKMSR